MSIASHGEVVRLTIDAVMGFGGSVLIREAAAASKELHSIEDLTPVSALVDAPDPVMVTLPTGTHLTSPSNRLDAFRLAGAEV
jgi:hypothetical protein